MADSSPLPEPARAACLLPLPSLPPSNPSLPLTAWARKYGQFSPTNPKSGYTPTEYQFPVLGATSPPSGAQYEAFQKRKLYGFTSRELAQLDCLPLRELKASNLASHIMPILRRENWEQAPLQPDFSRSNLYPLADGRGVWSAHNDVVWDVLEPILTLASKFVGSAYVLPWFDALLRSERKKIPDWRRKPEDLNRTDLRYFDPRPADQFIPSRASTADRDKAFDELQNVYKYTFAFMSQDEDPMEPADEPPGSALGFTATNFAYMNFDPTPNKEPRVFTWLKYSEFEPLLRTDITSAERMSIQWSIASTISHEVMHAVQYLSTDLIGNYAGTEDFFSQEALSEIGYSFEKAAGNLPLSRPFLDEHGSLPLGWFFSRYWPTGSDVANADEVELINPGVQMFDEMFPIPLSFYEDVHQEEFWSVAVRKFGHGIFHYRTRREGTRVQQNRHPLTGKIRVKGGTRFQAFNQNFVAPTNDFIASVESMEKLLGLHPSNRAAMRFGRSLILSSQAEQEFWDNTVRQEGLVKTAITAVADASRLAPTDENRRIVFTGLLECMRDAISKHEVQVAAIRSLESVNATQYPDRRAALKTWNRGTRVFLRNLKAVDTINVIDIEAPLLDLEICRMYLYDPTDESMRATEDFVEIQSISFARAFFDEGEFTLCRNLCLGVLASPWCSIFAQCGAEAIVFALDKDVFPGWDERKADLERLLLRLEYCTAGAPATWKAHWDILKTELVKPASLIPRPADPPVPLAQTDVGMTDA
ncbi:hypothetical protein BUE80_DR008027 [Diplocarpon rosae]|nr:hypothetical protein BUE80_DR008027 [Diplocarpon rosae]